MCCGGCVGGGDEFEEKTTVTEKYPILGIMLQIPHKLSHFIISTILMGDILILLAGMETNTIGPHSLRTRWLTNFPFSIHLPLLQSIVLAFLSPNTTVLLSLFLTGAPVIFSSGGFLTLAPPVSTSSSMLPSELEDHRSNDVLFRSWVVPTPGRNNARSLLSFTRSPSLPAFPQQPLLWPALLKYVHLQVKFPSQPNFQPNAHFPAFLSGPHATAPCLAPTVCSKEPFLFFSPSFLCSPSILLMIQHTFKWQLPTYLAPRAHGDSHPGISYHLTAWHKVQNTAVPSKAFLSK